MYTENAKYTQNIKVRHKYELFNPPIHLFPSMTDIYLLTYSINRNLQPCFLD